MFTHRSGAYAHMTRIDIDTGEKESRTLAKNRFRLNFDIHPSGDRILVVKSLLAENNLVKVSLVN